MIPSATNCYYPDHTVTSTARALQTQARCAEASDAGCLSTRSMLLDRAVKAQQARSTLKGQHSLLYAARVVERAAASRGSRTLQPRFTASNAPRPEPCIWLASSTAFLCPGQPTENKNRKSSGATVQRGARRGHGWWSHSLAYLSTARACAPHIRGLPQSLLDFSREIQVVGRTYWTLSVGQSVSRNLIAYMREQEGIAEGSQPRLWHRPSQPTRSCYLSVPRVKDESVRCRPAAIREYKRTYLSWPDPHGQTWSLFHYEMHLSVRCLIASAAKRLISQSCR